MTWWRMLHYRENFFLFYWFFFASYNTLPIEECTNSDYVKHTQALYDEENARYKKVHDNTHTVYDTLSIGRL